MPPAPPPPSARIHPDLVLAARWFLANVQPEPQRGFGRVKERAHFVCQNPECGRQNLRMEAHHIHFKSKGGSDELNNGIALCRACHLRLVHAGRVSVEQVGEALVWRFPGRVVVVF